MYEVTWEQSGDRSSLGNITTTETSYTIQGLTPDISYKIGVGTICNKTIRSEVPLQVYKTKSDSVNSGKLSLCCDNRVDLYSKCFIYNYIIIKTMATYVYICRFSMVSNYTYIMYR